MNLLSDFLRKVNHYNCIAIAGMAKNTGKTTVLNCILSDDSKKVRGITSIGYDGESSDQVTGTEKPTIYVRKNTLVATADGLLNRCDFTKELLFYTGFNSPMGEVIIVKALSDGYAQIAGPSTRSQMEKTVEYLRKYGAEQILIDGALSRKSTAAVAFSDACILATGAAFSHNIDEIVKETTLFAKLLSLQKYSDISNINQFVDTLNESEVANALANLEKDKTLFFKGAITSQLIKRLFNSNQNLNGLKIVGEDGTRFLIDSQMFADLNRRGVSLFVQNPINLIGITVNPKAPTGLILDSNEIVNGLEDNTTVSVIDIKLP